MTYSQPDYPALCIETGLNCESCTESTARELARACPGLPGRVAGQLFVQLHANPACSRMHGHFVTAYASASTVPVRKPVTPARVLAAVAAVA